MRFAKRNAGTARTVGRHAHQIRVRWAPSRTRRIVRHPVLWWTLAVALAIGGGARLSQQFDQLDEARSSWGATRDVVVVIRPVAVGEPIAESVEVQSLPAALVSDSAVASVSDQAFARVDLFAGEVLLHERLSATEVGELPAATAAITVTLAQHSPLVEIGDLVDLWAVDTAAGESYRVAQRVVVLALAQADLTVAVPQADVGDIAVAAVRPLTVALVG